ncbi:folate-binding protein [Caenimonas koreensis DSM 17982]|uniref:Folate-binding protein n=1 Tax=Caenimonas koreensis DSM 17982 TaxID=1121255 RepID=A0A844BDI7_9BURK|nr:folate-binding protein YgfZ [Caenimonas koreensis]MRD49769.1 folate-binding protein [Caenimonas koreensis DSM 17982]
MSDALTGVTHLPHLGVIRVEGADAASFLQGQLTQDFEHLATGQARLAAYCTPKGRMQASFIGLKLADGDIVLVMSADILPATLKRISMFVMRAKAKLRDATAEFSLYGVAGDALADIAPTRAGPWSATASGNATVIGLYPADGIARALWLAPAGTAAPVGPALSLEAWQASDIRSGVAMITAPIVEALVPQMLNYESIGGVNFKKGCYPGQEVVARSQFRGTLKRRAYLAHSQEAMTAGDEVFHSSDASQPCGIVAQAAPSAQGGWDAIVSMQITAAQDGVVTLRSGDGPALVIEPAPYPLLEDI